MAGMPNYYHSELGLPLRWQDEQSGQLPAAVLALKLAPVDKTAMPLSQLAMVINYCQYYIAAPCWDLEATEDETKVAMATLRDKAKAMRTREEIQAWIFQCLEIGIDPL